MTTLVYEACQPRGVWGMLPKGKLLKIRPYKGESESVISSFSVENNGISVYQNTLTFSLNQD